MIAGERRSWTQMIMGLPISVHRRGAPVDDDAFAATLFDELRSVDAMFSPYREDSVLSRLNAGQISGSDLPAAFTTVLAMAEKFRKMTDGAFDVKFSGSLDPSGLVKGWATERASRLLPPDAYLNAGGDMVIRSPGEPWRIGIEHPTDASGLLAVLSVRDGAVATSGTTHRGAHIVDPRTGRAATGIRQATVVGSRLTEADVWATALIARGTGVLDRDDPLLGRLVDRGFQALLVTDTGSLTATAGFDPWCAEDFPLGPTTARTQAGS